MELKVHLLDEPGEVFFSELQSRLGDTIVLTHGESLPTSPDYDILISGLPDRESIEASPNLKRLIIPWAGLPAKTRDLMRDYPQITIHNIHHNAVPMAEMAITLMLALAKELIPIDSALRKNDWSLRYRSDIIIQLAGKKVLIVGYGSVGKEIASRCRAFDMTVTAIRSSGTGKDADGVIVYAPSDLEELLPAAEVLFLSVPLTNRTKEMIGKRQLSLLPDRAIVINLSRGRIINEQALYESLKGGKIRAGLDVWYNYPEDAPSRANTPPSEYPLNELPNVVMTPHLAGHSDRIEVYRAEEIAALLSLAAKGKSLPNLVDLQRGY